MKFSTLAIFISLLFFNSCKEDSLSPQLDGDFLPLRIGNYWGYSYQSIDSLGIATDTIKWVEYVDSDTVVKGNKYYSIRDLFSAFMGFKLFYTNKSDGLYMFDQFGESLSLIFKYPVKQNELIYREYDTLKVINTLQETITPAGKFYCVVYQHSEFNNSQWYYENTYFCPGVGKIKVETGYTRDQINYKPHSVMQLEVYKIY